MYAFRAFLERILASPSEALLKPAALSQEIAAKGVRVASLRSNCGQADPLYPSTETLGTRCQSVRRSEAGVSR